MLRTAVVTGVTGQDGSYLSELLLRKGYDVYGLIRRSSVDTTERIKDILDHDRFHLIEGDITDSCCINRVISGIKPDEVYNLAAQSHVGTSFEQPVTTCEIDAVGPLCVLEAIRNFSPETRFYQASTSELFGNCNERPQNEKTRMEPNSPYAAAKLYAHNITGLYRRAYNLYACAGILFNHESPRRGENFVTRKITKYVASLFIHKSSSVKKDNEMPSLRLGNINAMRDWSHAKDMVYGMWLMMQQDVPDDFVLGSGHARSVEDFLRVAFKVVDADYNDFVFIDEDLYRPAEVNVLEADYSRVKRILGWEPSIPFEEMVEDMVWGDVKQLLKDGG